MTEEVIVDEEVIPTRVIVDDISGRIRLTTESGFILTNGVVKGYVIWLSANDSVDNWTTVEYEGSQDADIHNSIAKVNNDRLNMKRDLEEAHKVIDELKEVIHAMIGVEKLDGGAE